MDFFRRRSLVDFALKFFIGLLLGSTILVYAPNALASQFPKVDADLQSYDAFLVKSDMDFGSIPAVARDRDWVSKKLSHMYAVDQYMRHYVDIPYLHQYSPEETEFFQREFAPRFEKVDRKNADDLRALLELYYWFKIPDFGPVCDYHALIIVLHADHLVDFQRMVLGRLETLVKTRETMPSNYAYLYDRIAASVNDPSKRVLQRYGTQGTCVGPGKWLPWPVENERDLDRRRGEMGLGREADYIAGFKDICR